MLTDREAQLRSRLTERTSSPLARDATAAAIDAELARRRTQASRVISVEPPQYLVAELGPVPERLSQRRTWQRAARRIEMYRQEFDVDDPDRALGRQPRELRQRDAWQIGRRDIDAARSELQRDPQTERDPSRGLERDTG